MTKLIKCNNCEKIYIEDEANYKYIFECKKCNSEDYLQEMKEHIYNKYVKQAKEFWAKVASENGWSMNNRGCTIWVNKNNEMLDNVYNEENNKNSYIVQYENEKLIKTIK